MAILETEWASIRSMIERVVSEISGRRDSFFITGIVIKRDETKMLVWLKEFGDQPIPIVSFDYTVKIHDGTPEGTVGVAVGAAQPFKTQVKTVKVKVSVPKIGESVLVARELGSRRLPRCLGVIQGKDWLVAEVE